MTQIIEASDITEQGDEDASIRSQRDDFVFTPTADFSQPVIIRGTNRIFRQSPGLNVVPEPSTVALDELIGKSREIDTHLRLRRLGSIADIHLGIVTPEIISFKVEGSDDLFYFETPITKRNPLAFKRFSTLLSIPYAFTKKSPTFLNKVNFGYYLRLALMTEKAPAPIDLVYDAQQSDITYTPEATPAETDAQTTPETVTFKAYRVTNVLKAERQPGRSKNEPDRTTPPIATRIPFFADILSGVKEQLHAYAPEITPQLQSYALGYDDTNKGRHFARITFDSPATNFDFNGEHYQLGLNIETDFSGTSNDFGQVGLSFIVFRQICTNGMMAAWGTEDQAAMRNVYVTDQLAAAGFTMDDTAEGGSADAAQIKQQAEARFSVIFGTGGISVPVPVANAGLDTSTFSLGLKFFLESKTLQQGRLEDLKKEFGAIDEEEFVQTVTALQKSMKLSSPELIKMFLVEYMAGQVSGKQQFKSPWDIVQFLTLMARAYETAIIADIERKAIGFAAALHAQVTQKKAVKQVSLAEQYRGMVNESLLGQDA